MMGRTQGNSAAQNNLGVCFEGGTGTDKDLPKAAYWYEKSSNGGNLSGMCNWAYMLQRSGDPGKLQAATSLFRQAADAGLADAAFQFGCLLDRQPPVPSLADMVDRPALAFAYYRKAADAVPPHGRAAHRVGNMYAAGRAVPANAAHAMHYFHVAVQAGNTDALVSWGMLLERGCTVSQPADMAGGFAKYVSAAQAGHADGMYHAGRLLLCGFGTQPSDPASAAGWFEQAARAGHADAAAELRSLLAHNPQLQLTGAPPVPAQD